MKIYNKNRKLTLGYAKKHRIFTLCRCPLVLQIDGDSYTIDQIANSFSNKAYYYILKNFREETTKGGNDND